MLNKLIVNQFSRFCLKDQHEILHMYHTILKGLVLRLLQNSHFQSSDLGDTLDVLEFEHLSLPLLPLFLPTPPPASPCQKLGME